MKLDGRFRNSQGEVFSIEFLLKNDSIGFAIQFMDFERKTVYKDKHGTAVHIGDTIKEYVDTPDGVIALCWLVEEHPITHAPVINCSTNKDEPMWDCLSDYSDYEVVGECVRGEQLVCPKCKIELSYKGWHEYKCDKCGELYVWSGR